MSENTNDLPKCFGRYEPRRILGKGSTAMVYLARDPELDRDIVLKVLTTTLAQSDKSQQRFYREARFLAQLEHEAIVPLHDFGIENGQPYLVMRYMRGGSLVDQLSRGPLTPEHTYAILERISEALDLAHQKKIIHRDIKPLNILFDERGKAFLSDFGIAAITDLQGQITGEGTIGTAVFMSPEQASGEVLSYSSDIYSLGVVVFFTLTGRPPFDYSQDASNLAIMRHHIETQPLRLCEVEPSLPNTLEPVVAKALEKAPPKRYSDAGGFATAFRSALDVNNHTQSASNPIAIGTRPTDQISQPSVVMRQIWICKYCGYSFEGSSQNCPVCGSSEIRRTGETSV